MALLLVATFGVGQAGAVAPPITGLTSPTHPAQDIWYSDSDPSFAWEARAGILGYSFLLDQMAATEPDSSTIDITVPDFHIDTEVAVSLGAGVRPWGAAVADLNGDGDPDIVSANRMSGSVSVLLGDGQGGFTLHQERTFGAFAHSVAIGDVNGDGKPDALVTDRDNSYVRVFLNTGDDPVLAAGRFFPTGSKPKQIAVGDLDGDGYDDVVTADSADNTVSVLFGGEFGGETGLSAPQSYAAGEKPEAIELADLNGDGHLDVAVGNDVGNSVSILLNDGLGGLGAAVEWPVGLSVKDLCTGDFDGDGINDLASADYESNSVSILLGSDDGSFTVSTVPDVAVVPSGVVAADYDGDGFTDIVVSDWGADDVMVLLGNGDGSFRQGPSFPTADEPNALAGDDLNGDGLPDVVVVQSGEASSEIAVLVNATSAPSKTFKDVADGVWHFHVRTVSEGAVGGATAHRQVKIDTTAPVTEDDVPASVAGTSLDVTLTPTDSSSGVAGTWYKVDDAASWTPGTTFAVLGQGSHTIRYFSEDVAGNTESVRSKTFTMTVNGGYKMGPFLKPLRKSDNRRFKRARTVRIAFRVRDAEGKLVTSARPVLRVNAKGAGTVVGPRTVKYNKTKRLYIYNLRITKAWKLRTYSAKVTLGAGSTGRTVFFRVVR